MRLSSVLLATSLIGCKAPEGSDTAAESCQTGDTQIIVIQTLTWARVDDQNVSPGFDLDGEVTADGDSDGCGVADFTSPEGTPGVDNAFGRLLPTLEATEFSAVEGLIAQSVASGGLLITLELDDLDDPTDPSTSDDCAQLTIGRAQGTPLLGTDGKVEAGQTLERDPDGPTASFSDVAVEDGHMEVRGVTMHLPLQVFDVSMDFLLHDGALSLDWNEDGTWSGVFGGAVDADYIESIAGSANVDGALLGIMTALLDVNADLPTVEGESCGAVSINFGFVGVPAYFFSE